MKTLTVFALLCAMMALTTAAESRLVKRSTACSSDWSYLGGRCYHYVPTRMSWARAERNCQSLGGNLASVHNSQQYFYIQKLILENDIRPSKAWIGGTDAQEENQWFWSDGTPFRYHHWCHGEPDNNKGNQHCMQMNYSGGKCWDDSQCFHQLPSVCARKRR
ncbi:hypothetical protein ABVT39_016378 [Epinephelus coioides]